MTIHRLVGGVLVGILLAVVVFVGGLRTVTAQSGEVSLWPSTTPSSPVDADANSVELGVKFKSDVAGTITGLRYYRKSGISGTHTGSLWSATGTLLGRVTFSGTSTGWKVARFATPVSITANTIYVASYHAPSRYVAATNYFTTSRDSGPLHAPASTQVGGNGVYAYGSAASFPTQTYQATNYWIDVLFVPGAAPPPPCTFSVTPTSLSAAAGGTSSSVSVSASAPSCVWTASAGASWLSVSPSGGTGSGDVTVTSLANGGGSRSSTVNIAGQTVNVMQAGVPTGPGPLVVTCPANQTGTSPNGGPISMTWPTPTTTGGTAPINVTANPASGTLFSVGVTNVGVSASSADAQQASCGFTVTVTDSNGTTRTAASCSRADVGAVVALSEIGDTVIIPAGTCTWSSRLTLTKGITLRGSGVGATTLVAGIDAILEYKPTDLAANAPFRMTAFTVDLRGLYEGYSLNVTAPIPQTKIRIDHTEWKNAVYSKPFLIQGPAYGVVDHNTFGNAPHFDNYGLESYGGNGGQWEWGHYPTYVFGSPNNLYYEDNTITSGDTLFSGGLGGRYVFRYNTVTPTAGLWPMLDAHGNMGAGGNLSTMGFEVYGNLVTGSQDARVSDHRGGKALVFYNFVTKSGGLDLQVREEHCDSTSPPASTPDGQPQHVSGSYYWNNRDTGGARSFNLYENLCGSYAIAANRDFWQFAPTFTGTSGVGAGPLANRPGTCTVGVGYWATTQSVTTVPSASRGANPSEPLVGTLSVCTAPNTWTDIYQPYVYPHPLTAGQ